MKQKFIALLTILTISVAAFSGCTQGGDSRSQDVSSGSISVGNSSLNASLGNNALENSSGSSNASSNKKGADQSSSQENITSSSSQEAESSEASQLSVRFGSDGSSFTLYLYDNPTAAAIARHVGTASWQLPIYHYDGYENWEVMQYYDIPSRYEIPSDAESISSEAAGTVYYSEPNRIVLFFHEGEVSGEYTPVGYFDYTDEFVSAVENNPVLEGWGNKLVFISQQN